MQKSFSIPVVPAVQQLHLEFTLVRGLDECFVHRNETSVRQLVICIVTTLSYPVGHSRRCLAVTRVPRYGPQTSLVKFQGTRLKDYVQESSGACFTPPLIFESGQAKAHCACQGVTRAPKSKSLAAVVFGILLCNSFDQCTSPP